MQFFAKRVFRAILVIECAALTFGQIPLSGLPALIEDNSLASAQALTSRDATQPTQSFEGSTGPLAEPSALQSFEATSNEPTNSVVVPNHVHEFQYTRVVLSTCARAGYILRTCPIDSVTETLTIPALGHDYETSYRVDRYPTYDADGSKSIHCKRDGASKPGSAVRIARLVRPSSLNLGRQSVMRVGDVKKVALDYAPSSATPDILWSSSNTSVVSLNSRGEIAAHRAGTSVITARVRLSNGATEVKTFTQAVEPQAIARVSGYSASNKVYLYWPAARGAQEYRIYRATSTNGSYRRVKTTRSNSAKIAGGMRAGRSYTFKVVPVAAGEAGDGSALRLKISRGKVRSVSNGFSLAKGTTRSITPKGVASKKGIRYHSSNTKVASVSSRGTVTARGLGSATVVANYRGYRYATVVNVRTKPSVSVGNSSIVVGATTRIQLAGASASGWKSSNSKVARVSRAGTIRGVKAGSATVSINYLGRTYAKRITVKNPSVSLAKFITVQERHAEKIPYSIVSPHVDVKWTVADPSVARITKFGEVQGLKPGKTTVTASAHGKSARCTVTVTAYDVVSELNKLNLSHVNKVMIVAHPDDDALWGGAALLSDTYLVVNVTAGVVAERSNEFRSAMRYSGDVPMLLAYPDYKNNDLVRREIDDWSPETMNAIGADIKKILAYKNWSEVLTHSPEGESGHRQHRKTDHIVTQNFAASGKPANQLKYFGHLYSREEFRYVEPYVRADRMSSSMTARKNALLSHYPAQMGIINGHRHTNPYEKIYESPLYLPKY